jgi:hypothetical protein
MFTFHTVGEHLCYSRNHFNTNNILYRESCSRVLGYNHVLKLVRLISSVANRTINTSNYHLHNVTI